MGRKILFVLMGISVGLSGCDRLSEKEKMDMIAKCDSEARKKFKEESYSGDAVSLSVSVETHYSFVDKQCYALVKKVISVGGPNSIQRTDILFDGLTKKELLNTMCSSDEKEGRDDCRSGGGVSTGPLAESDGVKNDKGVVSYQDAMRIVDIRMNKP